MVRTKLNFDDQSSNNTLTSKKKGKENIPLKANKEQSDSDQEVSTDDEYDQEIKKIEIKRKSILPVKNKASTFLESLSGIPYIITYFRN